MSTTYRYDAWLFIFIVCSGFCLNLNARKPKTKTISKKLASKKVAQKVNQTKKEYVVRVLLRTFPLSKHQSIELSSPEGFWLVSAKNDTHQLSLNGKTVSIATHGGQLYVQSKRMIKDQFYLVPKKACTEFNGKQYKGRILLACDSASVYLINCINLEDYTCSVLRTESWPGWPLEVNKVLAIVSRSYVMAMMDQENKKKKLYHVCDTNVHQTYSGEHGSQVLRDAVAQTRGIFLTYGDKPILAMFDSCCGGIVPAYIDDFDFSKAPYLARSYPCKHCKRCSIFQWNADYSASELAKLLKSSTPKLSTVKNIRIRKRDKAGIVQEVMVDPGSHTISGKKIYSLLKAVKSFHFSVKKNRHKINFAGRGFGHHIGLCQWGAREMVRDGWDYKRILRFYYPSTKLAHLIV